MTRSNLGFPLRPAAFAVAALLALGAAACSEGPSGPDEPPRFVVNLLSPGGAAHGPDGAAVFEISGSGFESARLEDPASGLLFVEPVAGDRTLVAVILDSPGPIRFVLTLADHGPPPSVSLHSVSDAHDALRDSTAGYQVRLDAPGEEDQ